MPIDRTIPCVNRREGAPLTIEQAEQALAAAAVFIARVQMCGPDDFGLEAACWLDHFGGVPDSEKGAIQRREEQVRRITGQG